MLRYNNYSIPIKLVANYLKNIFCIGRLDFILKRKNIQPYAAIMQLFKKY